MAVSGWRSRGLCHGALGNIPDAPGTSLWSSRACPSPSKLLHGHPSAGTVVPCPHLSISCSEDPRDVQTERKHWGKRRQTAEEGPRRAEIPIPTWSCRPAARKRGIDQILPRTPSALTAALFSSIYIALQTMFSRIYPSWHKSQGHLLSLAAWTPSYSRAPAA